MAECRRGDEASHVHPHGKRVISRRPKWKALSDLPAKIPQDPTGNAGRTVLVCVGLFSLFGLSGLFGCD